jgi:carboxylate-amine ligase
VLPQAESALGEHEQVEREFKLSQLETGTPVCHTLDELADELTRMRHGVMAAAERTGARIAAAGTHPFSHWEEEGSEVTPDESYLGLERDYQRLARQKIVCGCHVHVGVSDPEDAIQILNRVRPWLPTILAVSVNSPFWLGEDTGYGSYRTEIWRRWPTAGTPDPFACRADFDRLVEVLLETGSIDDPARIHWDVRPSPRFPSLEFRVTDVCLTVDDAVTVAALVRALVRTCHAQAVQGEAPPVPRVELMRLATWRAARYGLEAELVDVIGQRSVPAHDALQSLVEFVRPALEEHGEGDRVSELVERLFKTGTAAARQRRAFERAGQLEDVVDFVVEATRPAGAA